MNLIGLDESHSQQYFHVHADQFSIGGNVKNFRIFPAAAGVIALTATACFAQDQRENEEADTFRTKVIVRSASPETTENSVPLNTDRKAGYIYLVEVEHGNKTREVMVDARTGKILSKRDSASKPV